MISIFTECYRLVVLVDLLLRCVFSVLTSQPLMSGRYIRGFDVHMGGNSIKDKGGGPLCGQLSRTGASRQAAQLGAGDCHSRVKADTGGYQETYLKQRSRWCHWLLQSAEALVTFNKQSHEYCLGRAPGAMLEPSRSTPGGLISVPLSAQIYKN